MRPKTRVSCVGLFSPSPYRRWTRLEEFCLRLYPLSFPSWLPVNIQQDKHAKGGIFIKLFLFKLLLRSILTMPCSGTAACTLRLTTWAKAGQCWGGLKPLLGSVALVLLVGTLAGWPLVSYTFMCNRLPCLAALWKISKWMSIDYICWVFLHEALQYLLLLGTLMVKLYFTLNCVTYPDAETHQLYSAPKQWFLWWTNANKYPFPHWPKHLPITVFFSWWEWA